jgi:small conductance mechanosensitive channel
MKEKIIALISEYSTLLWSYAIVRVSLTLLITWLASKYIPILVGKYLQQYPQVRRIIQKTGVTLIWMMGILAAMAYAGVDVSAIITSLGLLGFALGLALKDTVTNLISGVMIMLYSPFERGDTIEFGGHTGKVQWIDMKYTTLCNVVGMEEDDIILIPNQALFQKTIIVKEKAKQVESRVLQEQSIKS